MNSTQREMIQLREQHGQIAHRLEKSSKHLEKPRTLRVAAANLAWMVLPAQVAIDVYPAIYFGSTKLARFTSLEEAYDQNIQAAAAHKEANFEEYIGMAHEDMLREVAATPDQ